MYFDRMINWEDKLDLRGMKKASLVLRLLDCVLKKKYFTCKCCVSDLLSRRITIEVAKESLGHSE